MSKDAQATEIIREFFPQYRGNIEVSAYLLALPWHNVSMPVSVLRTKGGHPENSELVRLETIRRLARDLCVEYSRIPLGFRPPSNNFQLRLMEIVHELTGFEQLNIHEKRECILDQIEVKIKQSKTISGKKYSNDHNKKVSLVDHCKCFWEQHGNREISYYVNEASAFSNFVQAIIDLHDLGWNAGSTIRVWRDFHNVDRNEEF
ncbi:hypothetical protein GCM10011316_38550 [Roseibium aquae]|uniref:Uncharacterized protein n=1 Tax=Roseibium aquae TaxID=1323746 RepID=A0A916TPR8_9HYPH|nr:hypothetical protein [Roseibium aquae]GGB62941.1 hypothetical protein GCM10011316_38550 [Roseibium aquae]